MNDALQTYMNDHLGGATAATEALERLVDACKDPADRQFFAGLLEEIAADKALAATLLERLGGRRSAVREAGGWLSEKFLTLKARVDDPGGGLQQFEALETLAVGIHGKRALWRVLRALAPDLPGLAGIDFDALDARAVDQHDRVERRRVEVGRRIFGGVSAPIERPGA